MKDRDRAAKNTKKTRTAVTPGAAHWEINKFIGLVCGFCYTLSI